MSALQEGGPALCPQEERLSMRDLARHQAIVAVLADMASRVARRGHHAHVLEPAHYINDVYEAYCRLSYLFGLR